MTKLKKGSPSEREVADPAKTQRDYLAEENAGKGAEVPFDGLSEGRRGGEAKTCEDVFSLRSVLGCPAFCKGTCLSDSQPL